VDDLWLNEAFGRIRQLLGGGTGHVPHTDTLASHLVRGKLAPYLLDQGPASHPIRQPVRDTAEAASAFDAITYPKGASVLLQLMNYVGERTSHGGDGGLLRPHTWGTTTMQDLIDAWPPPRGP